MDIDEIIKDINKLNKENLILQKKIDNGKRKSTKLTKQQKINDNEKKLDKLFRKLNRIEKRLIREQELHKQKGMEAGERIRDIRLINGNGGRNITKGEAGN